MGLTSEEEERQGVAASLLGPLIPSEVKEAEERWRKKLIKSLDEPEKPLETDGEGVSPAEPPATDPPDPNTEPADQKSQTTKKPSGETSQAEEEAEEDTMDLELALERKKVKLVTTSICPSTFLVYYFILYS